MITPLTRGKKNTIESNVKPGNHVCCNTGICIKVSQVKVSKLTGKAYQAVIVLPICGYVLLESMKQDVVSQCDNEEKITRNRFDITRPVLKVKHKQSCKYGAACENSAPISRNYEENERLWSEIATSRDKSDQFDTASHSHFIDKRPFIKIANLNKQIPTIRYECFIR